MAEEKYCLFHIEGGLGKHVAATAVARCMHNNYPDRKIVIVCAYSEVFLNLNFIYRVYRIGNTPYFYNDYIRDKDTLIFKHEPYYTTQHIHKKTQLIENWCTMYGLQYKGEMPELAFNLRQKQVGERMWRRDRPIMLMNTNGGPLTEQPLPYSWTRDMPVKTAMALADHYGKNYHIIQVCRESSIVLPNVERIADPMSNMLLFSLLVATEKRILIDSALQHAAAALNKKSTVLWIGTSPMVFGYSSHYNIKAKLDDEQFKLPDSYMFDYSFNGAIHECPVMEDNMFDIDEIIATI